MRYATSAILPNLDLIEDTLQKLKPPRWPEDLLGPIDQTLAAQVRPAFPALARTPLGLNLAYLDGPAGSQVPQIVIDAFGDFYATCNVNTRGNFWASQEVDRRLAAAREVLATFLGAESASCNKAPTVRDAARRHYRNPSRG